MFITCSGCLAAYSCTDSETCLKDMVNQPDDKGYIKKIQEYENLLQKMANKEFNEIQMQHEAEKILLKFK